jgi:hypothetical protein
MNDRQRLDKLLLMLVGILFIWFFLSSLSIAYQRAPQQDDAMFATVVKNFLRGEGWATNYGEKILFNPDLTAGPALLLPAAPLIALFGNQPWVPAITGALVNITLSLLILYQLYARHPGQPASLLAFLLALSLFAANDFKTFTGYYTSALLFVLALLLVSNPRYRVSYRLTGFGVLAAIGLYTKPLILLSFITTFPLLSIWLKKHLQLAAYKSGSLILLGFFITLAPWHLYKTTILEQQGDHYQRAYQEYNQFFFEHHGSGLAQFREAENTLGYLKKNTLKNANMLQRFLKNHLGIPLAMLFVFSLVCCFYFTGKFLLGSTRALLLESVIACVVFINLLWFICFSFAMTPGHAFFAVFLAIFLLFYLLTVYAPSTHTAVFLCLLVSALLLPAHKPLLQAYSFRQDDPAIDNASLQEIIHFVDSQSFPAPLASCGYGGAPWRMIYLRQSSGMIVDCYNLLEDALQQQTDGQYQWGSIPDFVLVVEGLGLLSAAQSQAYVLGPLLGLCSKNVLYQQSFFSLCKIQGADLIGQLDPNQTMRELSLYREWYQTRLKI